ncbi:hypothetical protein Nos7524_0377 [Nostoc sp. PCC 7524]|uniref:hypothetical protein n=1 Tax=Nostoc sp. (strain ATCC 29411 / PCC 7524) TaxID=28072 RepID=UPI00029ED03C|nr:hypothetical protein [Nostoc sp. PCC 7524]AFY46292.1 hypothetical protein Nos7524_0377 [Nostoc sp. PCC 7524]
MQKNRPSNIFIRAFVLIFIILAIFILGSIIQQAQNQPERLEEPEVDLSRIWVFKIKKELIV